MALVIKLKYITYFKNSVRVELNLFPHVSRRMATENGTEVSLQKGHQSSTER